MTSTVGEAHIDVTAEAGGLSNEVRAAADKAAKAATIKLEAELKDSGLSADAKRAALKAQQQVQFQARLKAERLAQEASAAATRAGTDVQFNADTDFADVVAQAKLVAREAKTKVEFEATLNRRGFTKGADGIFRDVEGGALSAERAVQELTGAMTEGGGSSGFFTKALNGVAGAAGRAGAGIAAVVAIVEILLPYAVAVGGGIIALAGQLAFASAQAIPLATNLGAIGLAAVTAIVATRGLGDAYKAYGKYQEVANSVDTKTVAGRKALKKATDEYNASVKNLAPSARDFVKQTTDLQDKMEGLRRVVQQNFFAGLGKSIKETATDLLPTLKRGLGDTASVLNSGAQALLKWARSSAGIKTIRDIFSGLNGILKPLVGAAKGFGSGLVTIFRGALGPGKDLAKSIEGIGQSFGRWAKGFVKGGGLSDLLDKASRAGGALWDILKNVGSILGSLFEGSDDLGSGLLQSLADITKGFGDMLKTPKGQAQMKDFFKTVGDDLHGLYDLLKVAIPAFVTFVQSMQQLADIFNDVGKAVEPIAGPLGTVIGLLAGGPGGLATGFPLLGFLKQLPGLLDGLDFSKIGGSISGGIGGLVGSITSGFSGLADKAWSAAGDLGTGFLNWVSSIPGMISTFVGQVVTYFSGLADKALAAAGDIASAVGTWLAGLPSAAIVGITNFLVAFNDLAGRAITAAGDIIGGFTNWLAGLPAAAVYALATLTGTFAGLAIRLFTAAGDATSAFLTWAAGLPAAAGQLAIQIGAALVGLGGRLFAAAGSAAGAFQAWVAGLPAQASALASRIALGLAGLGSRLFTAAGSALAAFQTWVNGLPGAAVAAAARVAASFSGLAGRAIAAAGSIVAAATRWLSGVARAGSEAASRLVASFRGLASRIVAAIGTIIPKVQMPSISGIVGRIKSAVQDAATPNARGGIVTSPQFSLIGEAGAEAIIPLTRGNSLDPSLVPLLRSVANDRGISGTGGGGGQHNEFTINVPTPDPEAVALAVANRLAFELAS